MSFWRYEGGNGWRMLRFGLGKKEISQCSQREVAVLCRRETN